MSDDDKAISLLEAQLPALSGVAFTEARKQMLASGQSVLQSDQGMIYRVSPSGETTPIKRIDPPTQVKKGDRIQLR
jgi:hypothetical protein